MLLLICTVVCHDFCMCTGGAMGDEEDMAWGEQAQIAVQQEAQIAFQQEESNPNSSGAHPKIGRRPAIGSNFIRSMRGEEGDQRLSKQLLPNQAAFLGRSLHRQSQGTHLHRCKALHASANHQEKTIFEVRTPDAAGTLPGHCNRQVPSSSSCPGPSESSNPFLTSHSTQSMESRSMQAHSIHSVEAHSMHSRRGNHSNHSREARQSRRAVDTLSCRHSCRRSRQPSTSSSSSYCCSPSAVDGRVKCASHQWPHTSTQLQTPAQDRRREQTHLAGHAKAGLWCEVVPGDCCCHASCSKSSCILRKRRSLDGRDELQSVSYMLRPDRTMSPRHYQSLQLPRQLPAPAGSVSGNRAWTCSMLGSSCKTSVFGHQQLQSRSQVLHTRPFCHSAGSHGFASSKQLACMTLKQSNFSVFAL